MIKRPSRKLLTMVCLLTWATILSTRVLHADNQACWDNPSADTCKCYVSEYGASIDSSQDPGSYYYWSGIGTGISPPDNTTSDQCYFQFENSLPNMALQACGRNPAAYTAWAAGDWWYNGVWQQHACAPYSDCNSTFNNFYYCCWEFNVNC